MMLILIIMGTKNQQQQQIATKQAWNLSSKQREFPNPTLKARGKKIDSVKESSRKISPLTRQSMGTTAIEVAETSLDDPNMGKKKSNPPINPRNPMTGKYTSRLSLTSEQQVKWNESQAKGEKNPNLGPPSMKQIDIDTAAQRLVQRIRLSSTLLPPDGYIPPMELQTPPTKSKMIQGLNPGSNPTQMKETSDDPRHVIDSALNRVNTNNIFANLGGEISSDEEKEVGNLLEVDSREVDVTDKTSRAKKVRLSTGMDDSLNQGILPPRYEILKKADSLTQTSMKFSMHCGKYIGNKCNDGDKCRFSHDLDSSPTNRDNPLSKAANVLVPKSRAYP